MLELFQESRIVVNGSATVSNSSFDDVYINNEKYDKLKVLNNPSHNGVFVWP